MSFEAMIRSNHGPTVRLQRLDLDQLDRQAVDGRRTSLTGTAATILSRRRTQLRRVMVDGSA